LRTLNAKNSNLAINRSFHGHDIINRISYHPDVKKRSLHENGYAGMKWKLKMIVGYGESSKKKYELWIAIDRYTDRYKEKVARVVSKVKKGKEEWRKGHAEEEKTVCCVE
jgi:hypothetical protein